MVRKNILAIAPIQNVLLESHQHFGLSLYDLGGFISSVAEDHEVQKRKEKKRNHWWQECNVSIPCCVPPSSTHVL